MTKLKVAVGSDHAGYAAKQQLMQFLSAQGHSITDCGTSSEESTDYPDYAVKVADVIKGGRADRGFLLCGTGIGMCIAANKISGIRAALAWEPAVAELAAQHNWSNILCLPSRFVAIEKLQEMAKIWLETPYDKDARHERRVMKIVEFERQS